MQKVMLLPTFVSVSVFVYSSSGIQNLKNQQDCSFLSIHWLSLGTRVDMRKREMANDSPLLPMELLIEILSWLPVISLLRFKCVSKSWYDLIRSPSFVKIHLTRSLLTNSDGTLIVCRWSSLFTFNCKVHPFQATGLYDEGTINLPRLGTLIGSRNGLVCFSNHEHQLSFFNPATRAYKMIPQFASTKEFTPIYLSSQFAYDCISEDYKILRFVRLWVPGSVTRGIETHFYSLKADAWETLANPPWLENSAKGFCILVNNSLHWMGCDYKEIKCFDLSTRSYYQIPLPKKISPDYSPTLTVLQGQLCIITYYIDVWMLKEYGVHESWTRVFHCPSAQWSSFLDILYCWDYGLSLACSMDGSKIVVALVGVPHIFICCDLESKIRIRGLPYRIHSILPWVESLVPLSD